MTYVYAHQRKLEKEKGALLQGNTRQESSRVQISGFFFKEMNTLKCVTEETFNVMFTLNNTGLF